MNLRKRLSLAFASVLVVVLALLLAFDASQSRKYLNEQLGRNAQDAATSLALAMQSAWGEQGDVAVLQSLGDALFDRGLYQRLELTDSQGQRLIRRMDSSPTDAVPAWFQAMMVLEPAAGVAEVSDGWRTLGVLEIEPHPGLAYGNLWQRSVRGAVAVLLGILLSIGFVYLLMNRLFEPVERVRQQVSGWALGSFDDVPEPDIDEIRPLVASMNRSNQALSSLFVRLERDLHLARREVETDPVTGLLNRQAFEQRLDSQLDHDDVFGALVMVQLSDLAGLNDALGYVATDKVLCDVADVMRDAFEMDAMVARISGTDFVGVHIGSDEESAQHIVRRISEQLKDCLPLVQNGTAPAKTVATLITPSDTRPSMLSRLDRALLESVDRLVVGDEMAMPGGRMAWHQYIEGLWDQGQLVFESMPVVNAKFKPNYWLLMGRLRQDSGETISALSFMPVLSAHDRLVELDRAAVNEALKRLKSSRHKIGVTLSRASLMNPSALQAILDLTLAYQDRIVFEISEADLMAVQDRWGAIEQLLRRLEHWVLKHAGLASGTLDLVRRFQPRAVKLDPSLIQGAMNQREKGEFVRTTAHILHSLDCTVWAEGIADQATWEWAIRNQLDGGQGHFMNDL